MQIKVVVAVELLVEVTKNQIINWPGNKVIEWWDLTAMVSQHSILFSKEIMYLGA